MIDHRLYTCNQFLLFSLQKIGIANAQNISLIDPMQIRGLSRSEFSGGVHLRGAVEKFLPLKSLQSHVLKRMWKSSQLTSSIRRGSKVLLIIAHPDDEALFFSPLLIALNANLCELSLLCLSTGGFDGLGSTRRIELLKSADCYCIDRNHVYQIDHENLQDGKESNWSPELIRNILVDFLTSTEFDVVKTRSYTRNLIVLQLFSKFSNIIPLVIQVITFDEGGVSAHPNHIATHRGTQLALTSKSRKFRKILGLKLHTTSYLRQFMGAFDIPLSIISSEYAIVNFNVALVLKGMAAHKSQNVWYRVLFVLFCRYTYVNTFRCIN